MSTATSESPTATTGIPGNSRLTGILFTVLILICYWPTVAMTSRILAFSDDMAHGLFAPMVAAYLVWLKRDRIFEPPAAPSAWGLVLLGAAAMLAMVATLANSSTFSRFALLVTIAGVMFVAGGAKAFRRVLFPWLLLFFTFPVPAVLYGELTLPLQLLATRLSEHTFEALGMSVVRDGNILELAHQRLSVVEACSGIRSLITLFFFCAVYAYFAESRRWVRIGLALAAVPAAIATNVMRIVATGLLGKINMEYTHGVYHDTLGWSAFLVGFSIVFVLHRVLTKPQPPVI
ncbi:MAG: exosortase/archaeosortase family protein [Bryobacterales bacterium]|nr:exosortase/archaeosortase family protein [Bryobacterales bacterium]